MNGLPPWIALERTSTYEEHPLHSGTNTLQSIIASLQAQRGDGLACTKNSSNTRVNHGGARRRPALSFEPQPLRVQHLVIPSDPMYPHHFWLWPEPIVATSAGSSSNSLWFIPNRTLRMADHADLASTLKLSQHTTKLDLFIEASKRMKDFDTLVFTHRMDPRARCEKIELVALHAWSPYRCPAHPALRRGSDEHSAGACTCRVPQRVHCWQCARGDCGSMERPECAFNRTWIDQIRHVC